MAFPNVGSLTYLPPLAPLGQAAPLGPQQNGQPGGSALPQAPTPPSPPIMQPPQIANPLGAQGGPMQSPLASMVAPWLSYAMSQQIAQQMPQLFPQATQATKTAQPATRTPATTPASVPSGYYQNLAAQFATDAGIDPMIFQRQINQESSFNPDARGAAGEIGLGQFMPGTAQGLGIDPSDPVQNLQGAANLMASYYKKYGSMALALAAYNAGSGTVDAYLAGTGDIPDSTKGYIAAILGTGG